MGWPDQHINPYLDHPKSISVHVKAGSILVINSNLWHRGGNNTTGKRRRIINVTYRKRNLKQGLNQRLYIGKKIKKSMDDFEKYIFKIRNSDNKQKEKIIGPGNIYRKWLKKNPKKNFLTLKNT